jgi:hypothetical protein
MQIKKQTNAISSASSDTFVRKFPSSFDSMNKRFSCATVSFLEYFPLLLKGSRTSPHVVLCEFLTIAVLLLLLGL